MMIIYQVPIFYKSNEDNSEHICHLGLTQRLRLNRMFHFDVLLTFKSLYYSLVLKTTVLQLFDFFER